MAGGMDSLLVTLVVFVGVMLAVGMAGFALASNGPTNKQLVKRLDVMKDRLATGKDNLAKAQMKRILAMRDSKLDNFFKDFIPRPAELRMRLVRTGKSWTLGQYVSVVLGSTVVAILLLEILTPLPFIVGLLGGIFLGVAIPHGVLAFLVSKRQSNFNRLFPDAIDLMVRGLRSGLPITESLGIVGKEIPDPVSTEFRTVADKIRIGRTMEQALADVGDRVNTPEFRFFMITLSIQRETGGNLAETLNNLSEILRKRAQLKLKIKALSSESKASAYIVGSLPFIMFAILLGVNPTYMSAFWTDMRMMMVAGGALCWMAIGVFMMYKMVNFEV
jgi:tight adherence protein B